MTPDSGNIMVGSGEVWFNRKETDGTYKGFRHLGNVSKLEITPTPTIIEKKSSMNAARAVIARAITETKIDVALTLDEFDPKNVALALLGDSAAFTQDVDAAVADADLGTAHKGYALDTGFVNITVTAVKKGATTFDEGTDYTVDAVSGLIMVLEGGTIDEDDALTWDGSVPAIASVAVQACSNGHIEGRLRYRSSADQVGPRTMVDIYRLALSPSGAIALIGDAFAEIPLSGEALSDSSKPVGEQFAKVTYLPAAA
jgi:hypothetical protein